MNKVVIHWPCFPNCASKLSCITWARTGANRKCRILAEVEVSQGWLNLSVSCMLWRSPGKRSHKTNITHKFVLFAFDRNNSLKQELLSVSSDLIRVQDESNSTCPSTMHSSGYGCGGFCHWSSTTITFWYHKIRRCKNFAVVWRWISEEQTVVQRG